MSVSLELGAMAPVGMVAAFLAAIGGFSCHGVVDHGCPRWTYPLSLTNVLLGGESGTAASDEMARWSADGEVQIISDDVQLQPSRLDAFDSALLDRNDCSADTASASRLRHGLRLPILLAASGAACVRETKGDSAQIWCFLDPPDLPLPGSCAFTVAWKHDDEGDPGERLDDTEITWTDMVLTVTGTTLSVSYVNAAGLPVEVGYTVGEADGS